MTDRRTRAALRRIAVEVESMIDEKRAAAGFAALEALESQNQDAAEQRQLAIELSAQAKGCYEVLQLVREELAESITQQVAGSAALRKEAR